METFFDIEFMLRSIPKVIEALPITLLLLVLSMIFGLLLGGLLTWTKMKAPRGLQAAVGVYVSFMRGTPPLVQLFLIYYGLPNLLGQLGMRVDSWDKLVFAIIAFTLSNAAYLSETMRSAYLAIPAGQHEAAQSVGMTGFQAFRRIIFPQALAVAIPNIGNSLLIVFKDSSLAFSIGIVELLGKAKLISAAGYGAKNLEVFVAAAIVYWISCMILEYGTNCLEKRYKRKMGLAV
ncbi:amino acid ABC transporter permease [Paenibacillus sanguinis]|uniref:amino acid ABC transporter permease n=1 Tax=Paenibacillus sanguinis TaxID=225906 RepID=UPI0003747DE2|nr:amino acid ABC transporter permease [Paenibacillus sanguinis]